MKLLYYVFGRANKDSKIDFRTGIIAEAEVEWTFKVRDRKERINIFSMKLFQGKIR